ncbi:transglutaminase family protein [Geobacter sp. AOG2]|uniref:transglutaminase-like domain-containing protein n=1 Tax=Geobacter sp. AOG2 TaxID=1566347 RepID=UPI001CC74A8B|nr:transglutaminase-like domain-containing protein [Geobacter sp. AOG2]GFE62317.1 transglutaminase [Geobacter sp. AOG2]
MRIILRALIVIILTLSAAFPATAALFKKLDKPPLSERWFGIYVDNERVGFYRQVISETPDGYLMEGDGSTRMKVMGFSKESATRETYLVGKSLALRSFEVEQAINGTASRISGRVSGNIIRIKSVINGKTTEKQLKCKGEVYPGPALNLYPLMHDVSTGRSYTILSFDPEEVKVKEVRISVLGEGKTPDSQPALKLRNNLYPFVNNDIWVDDKGNTLLESVREGLVITRAEDPKQLGSFVGGVALAKKDLIYDFSLVRAEPPIADSKKLTGLSVEISGWNDSLPLLQEGGQTVERGGEGRIIVKTGQAVAKTAQAKESVSRENYLKPAEKIESDAPEIVAKAKDVADGRKEPQEIVKALVSWTSDWMRDTVEDGGGAVASLKSRTGNCQTHARLYTALARAAGIPTRFVSGLVYLDGKGFLYHSWAESLLNGRWVAVDPTYDQVPADPTHLKLLEGHLPEDMAPIVAIIGRIHIKVLETMY